MQPLSSGVAYYVSYSLTRLCAPCILCGPVCGVDNTKPKNARRGLSTRECALSGTRCHYRRRMALPSSTPHMLRISCETYPIVRIGPMRFMEFLQIRSLKSPASCTSPIRESDQLTIRQSADERAKGLAIPACEMIEKEDISKGISRRLPAKHLS